MTYEVPDLTGDPNPTAALNAFIASVPDGATIVNPYTLRIDGTVNLPDDSGKRLQGGTLYRSLSLPWRVVPDPATNPDGRSAQWQYDALGGRDAELASLHNPSGTHADSRGKLVANAHGSNFGGYDATDEWPPIADGGGFDGKHLKALYGAPWTQADVGKAITVLIVSGSGGSYNEVITGVSDDGTEVYWDTPTTLHEDVSHTVAWAINHSGAGWVVAFGPDPAWQPKRYARSGTWTNYVNALQASQTWNCAPVVQVGANCTLDGVTVIGANLTWALMVYGWDKSVPVVTEFQRCVATSDHTSHVLGCNIHHAWGDAIVGAGLAAYNRFTQTGRCGLTINWDHMRVLGNVFDQHRHSPIDIELDDRADIKINDNCFGTKAGIAWSRKVTGFEVLRNHSTKADVDAGTIAATGGLFATAVGGGSNVRIERNVFDHPAQKGRTDPALKIGGVDGLTIKGNRINTNGYFLQPWTRSDRSDMCTNIVIDDTNDGGPTCKGLVAP